MSNAAHHIAKTSTGREIYIERTATGSLLVRLDGKFVGYGHGVLLASKAPSHIGAGLRQAGRTHAIQVNSTWIGLTTADAEAVESMTRESEADQAWRVVQRPYDKAEQIREAGGVSDAIAARAEADKSAFEWAAKYPVAAKQRRAKGDRQAKACRDQIERDPTYKAMAEWRD